MKARKQGSTYAITGTLRNQAGAVNLTGSTVTLSMRDAKTQAVKISSVGVTLTDAVNGRFSLAVLAAYFDTPNPYEIMMLETRADGTKWPYPNSGYEPLVIEESFS